MTDRPSPSLAAGGRNAALKLAGIALMTLLTAVPLLLIASLVAERRSYAAGAAADIAQGWGGAQTVAGPFLVIPYTVPERRDERGAILAPSERGELVVLARTLDAKAAPAVEERARGIFRVPVYAAELELSGSFARPTPEILPAGAAVDWTRAHLALGIADVRGISGDVTLNWNGRTDFAFAPGTGVNAVYGGIQTNVPIAAGDMAFTLKLRLRGTGRLAFVPSAEAFTAAVASPWPHPSFEGAYLPERREIGDAGFTAVWRVSHLARQLPQSWNNAESVSLEASAFGVTFYQPVDFYQLVERSLKYAILFIGLSFLVFFLAETVTGARIHVVQYLLAGAAQVIFYLLLLALAEQTGFTAAYLGASFACIGLTALYAGQVLGSRKRALAVAGALTLLYGLLYTLLNEEDYALLTGAVASFLALALTMFLTRRIDWYQAQASAADALAPPPRT
jgi:inner membrane protein